MRKTTLSLKLIEAREKCGYSRYDAAMKMPNTRYQTLWHLEGRAKGKKPPSGPDISLKTAVDIVQVYWPEIQLDDLMPEINTLRFIATDMGPA